MEALNYKPGHVEKVSPQTMNNLLEQVKNEDFNHLENSQNFQKISQQEFKEILDYVKTTKNFTHFVCVNPVAEVDQSRESIVANSLEDSWVFVDRPLVHPSETLAQSLIEVENQKGFFDDWPSFGVTQKMSVVMNYTGTAMFYGYLVGAKAAMDSLYRIAERPFIAAGLSALTSIMAWLSPQLFVRVVQYVIIGGVVGAASVATPVFVVGTTGVFVSASVYHSFILAKRGVNAVMDRN